MSLKPKPPETPQETASASPWGGPTFSYRGARIECMKGAHVYGLFMESHRCTG